MKCKSCNGTGKIKTIDFAKQGWKDTENVCPICYGTGAIEQTNKEYIRTCGDEDLVEIFMSFMFDAGFKKRFIFGNFKEEFIRWLKEKHDESV